jgi:acyl-coenzyme A synthetase/AMP-(fatty) acid ligase
MNLAEEALRIGRNFEYLDRPAFYTATGRITHAEFRQIVLTVANDLLALGIQPGDKVLLRMTNSVEFAAAFLAAVWTGAIPVLVNSQFGKAEIEHVVRLSTPVAVLYLSRTYSKKDGAQNLAPDRKAFIVTCEGLQTLSGEQATKSRAVSPEPVEALENDIAFVVFTSGTTGKPKGVVHAHRWLAALGDSNRARVPPQSNDVILATGEWSFISALGHNVLFPLRNGVAGSIMEERASPERILATIARDGVTLLHSVATLYRRILGSSDIEQQFDLCSLRGANSTGEPLESSVRAEWRRRVGCPIWEHYGVSEAQMVLGDGPNTPQKEGSVGKSWGADPMILAEDGQPMPVGGVGRLAFDGSYPGFFLGYLGDPEQTSKTLRNGVFFTNDLARMDNDGYVYILGRVDDCFKSKGVLIVPSELESAILSLGAFEEACVFAIPDNEIGNRIGVTVIPRASAPPGIATRPGLTAALEGLIAPFKIPHQVIVTDQLPKNANGKTQRTEVARLAGLRG